MRESIITSPIKAIRAKCVQCCGDAVFEVKNCTSEGCPLYEFRFGKNPYWNKEKPDGVQTNPVKVCRLKCIECNGDNSGNVVLRCPIINCPIHPFRMGENPYRKSLSAKQKEAVAKNLLKGNRT